MNMHITIGSVVLTVRWLFLLFLFVLFLLGDVSYIASLILATFGFEFSPDYPEKESAYAIG